MKLDPLMVIVVAGAVPVGGIAMGKKLAMVGAGSPDASDKDIKCLVREMKAQLKGQNTRTAAQIRGERIVDSE